MNDNSPQQSETVKQEPQKQRASFWTSVGFALSGLLHAWQTERNIRIQCVCAIIVLLVSWSLEITRLEWVLIILVCGLVLAAEVINTAIERVVDLSSPDTHPLAKAAKDAAAGMVLLVCLIAVAIGVLVLGPPLIRFGFGG